eukprot:gene26446-17545_t
MLPLEQHLHAVELELANYKALVMASMLDYQLIRQLVMQVCCSWSTLTAVELISLMNVLKEHGLDESEWQIKFLDRCEVQFSEWGRSMDPMLLNSRVCILAITVFHKVQRPATNFLSTSVSVLSAYADSISKAEWEELIEVYRSTRHASAAEVQLLAEHSGSDNGKK